jgi:hypothetical protein
MSVLSTVLIALGVGAVGLLAKREHRSIRATREALFDDCASALEDPEITLCGDGFPCLVGKDRGRSVHVQLISDTMVVRRLPQLWLFVTMLERLRDLPTLAILVRPAGYEFYSLTSGLTHAIGTPATLPQGVLIRGSDTRAEGLLERLTPALAVILADPRVKEVAMTSKGVRIIRQAAEGRRGEHLLLRQPTFDDAKVTSSDLVELLDQILLLRSALDDQTQKQAA